MKIELINKELIQSLQAFIMLVHFSYTAHYILTLIIFTQLIKYICSINHFNIFYFILFFDKQKIY